MVIWCQCRFCETPSPTHCGKSAIAREKFGATSFCQLSEPRIATSPPGTINGWHLFKAAPGTINGWHLFKAGWEHVYSATIEPAENFAEIRKDFGFDDAITGWVFIHQAVFHQSLRQWQQMIIDSICKMFPESTATFMWKGTTDLSDKELASLGFRIVAGHDLLFRPNRLVSEYDTAQDDRNEELHLPPDAQDYVEENWEWDEY